MTSRKSYEFDDYLKCGRLEHDFLRVHCDSCHAEHLVAFLCNRRGFCPSCCDRHVAESAARLVDEIFTQEYRKQERRSVENTNDKQSAATESDDMAGSGSLSLACNTNTSAGTASIDYMESCGIGSLVPGINPT